MKVPGAKEIGITIRTHKLCNKALMLCSLHKFTKSVKCVDKVIELNPTLAKAWNLKGLVYDTWGKILEDNIDREFRFGEIKQKRLEASVEKNMEALNCYGLAVSLNPKYLKAWNNKASILVRLGKAIEVHQMQGRVLPQLGFKPPRNMYEEALYCCDQVLILGQTNWESEDTASLNPTKTEERGINLDISDNHGWDSSDRMAQRTHLMKGKIFHFHLANLQSIYDYANKKYTTDDPEFDNTVDEITNKYLEEAVTCYETAIKLNQQYIEAWHYMGLAFWGLDKDEASECFVKVIKLDPKNVTMLEELGDVNAQMEETNGEYREYIFDKMPTSCDPIGIKNSIYCFKKLVKLDPENAIAWNKLGLLHHWVDDIPESIKCFHKAIKFDPEDPGAWNNLGNAIRYDKGDAENNETKAQSCYAKALEIDPGFHVRFKGYTTFQGLYYRIGELKQENILRKWQKFKKQKEEYKKKKLEIKLLKDEVKISEIWQNCSLSKNVLEVALDIYRNIDEFFGPTYGPYPKGFTGIILPNPGTGTRKSEMLQKPPFAAAIVYMACKQCDVTNSIEKILQKVRRPKKVKSSVVHEAENYYKALLQDRLDSWHFTRY